MTINHKIEELLNWFSNEKNIGSGNIHGKNILQKLKNYDIYNDKQKKSIYIIANQYIKIIGKINNNNLIKEKIKIFLNYKEWLGEENKDGTFTSQGKLEPTVLEEIMFFLFKDCLNEIHDYNITENGRIFMGSKKAYSNLYFSPNNFKEFLDNPFIQINVKDQDFSICRKVKLYADNNYCQEINVPIVSIECKTYLDKTMLEGAIATADKIKNGNPHSLFLIVTETYAVDMKIDPKYSRIDQIFILRKQTHSESKKNKNTIDEEIIIKLYEYVKNHLKRNWSDLSENIKKNGTLF